MSLKRGLDEAREEYRNAALAAPPIDTPANAPISQDLSDAPIPFLKMRRPKYLPRHVASEFICYKCSREINVWRPLRGKHRVFCVMCNAPYQESCMGEGAKNGSMRPCCPSE